MCQTGGHKTAVLHGSYNLEKVLNFGSRLEKSFNLVKVHMTPIFFTVHLKNILFEIHDFEV